MPGVAQRYWTASTLQGRRWLMEKRLEAVELNDLAQLRQLLAAQTTPKPRELTSALEIAVMKKSDDYAECVQLLLQYGANPDGQNGSGTPFLHLAADANCHRIVSLLVKYNCDVSRRREDGSSAVHRAAWHGHMSCLSVLLDAGADTSVVDALGRTPLLVAAQRNQTAAAEALLAANCSVNVCDNHKRSTLYWAVFHENLALVIAVLSRPCQLILNQRASMDGVTPLILAAQTGNVDIMRRLLEAGAAPDLQNLDGVTALNMAARNEKLACLQLLVFGGCDVNVGDADGRTALIMLLNHPNIIELLLNAGADPNVAAHEHITCLWLATTHCFVTSGKLLLQYNARVDVPSGADGSKLPLHVAIYNGSMSLVKMLFITSIAMAANLRWLRDYLNDENLRSQAADDASVALVTEWIRDVLDTFYRPSDPPALKCSCRTALRRHLGSRALWPRINQLQLPNLLKNYLKLKELDQHVVKET